MIDQHEKFERFEALRTTDGAFVMPNPWDAGSARLPTALGSHALATTSAGTPTRPASVILWLR